MTEDQLRDELDKWKMVRYRMDDEGMDYCFMNYSSFPEIQDEEFHTLRLELIDLMEKMEQFLENKIEEIEDKIIELDEQ